MQLKHAALVLVDISGYTQFLRKRNLTLLHAEEIITQLLEVVIDAAEYPLTLNKLEGDAAFLYALMNDDHEKVAKDILKQTLAFFPAFEQKIAELDQDTAYCDCDACSNISQLKLKAFLHHGEVVIKQIRQFEELAGEEVILIHRLLKNGVKADEYILMSDAFVELTGGIPDLKREKRKEKYGDDSVEVEVFYPKPQIPPLVLQSYTPRKANMFGAQIKRLLAHSLGKHKSFKHISHGKIKIFAYFREMMG
ncbi:MAG: DUF2652 domain-containing protein [Chloroflexi bacterium]|nr:DUF2652 domain-containing protein [Chloroflexota bacterium]